MLDSRIVILTRPGNVDQTLMGELMQAGVPVWHWPAFRILPVDNPEIVREKFLTLDADDLVVFVSPNAVVMTHAILPEWPRNVGIACAGVATAKIVRALWGEDLLPIYPGDTVENSGSEALFELLKKRGFPKRVVIARAQTGREWFAEVMRTSGVEVETLCVYKRLPLELSKESLDSLRVAIPIEPPILYVTSSEAFSVLLSATASVAGAKAWLQRGMVLTIHERCVKRACELGFEHVELVSTTAKDILAALKYHLSRNALTELEPS